MLDEIAEQEIAVNLKRPQRRKLKHAITRLAYGDKPEGFTKDEIELLRYAAARLPTIQVPDPYIWLANVWYGDPRHVCDRWCYQDACLTRLRIEGNVCENPYLRAFRSAIIKDRLFQGLNGTAYVRNRFETAPGLERNALVDEYSWAIPNDAALRAIAECGPVFEVGAGGGYWAYCLRALGVDVIATDPDPPPSSTNRWCKRSSAWTAVETLTAVRAARRYCDRALLMCWPPLGPEKAGNYANRCMKAYYRRGGKTLIYVGERGDGCTGGDPDSTQWVLEREVEIPQWFGIHDDLTIWRRL